MRVRTYTLQAAITLCLLTWASCNRPCADDGDPACFLGLVRQLAEETCACGPGDTGCLSDARARAFDRGFRERSEQRARLDGRLALEYDAAMARFRECTGLVKVPANCRGNCSCSCSKFGWNVDKPSCYFCFDGDGVLREFRGQWRGDSGGWFCGVNRAPWDVDNPHCMIE